MFRRTKIIATLGPACSDAEQLAALIEAGVNVFRLNFSHGDAHSQQALVARVRQEATQAQAIVALLADLQGPKIRIGCLPGGKVTLQSGDVFTLDIKQGDSIVSPYRVGTSYPELIADCKPGDMLLLNDGLIEMEVTSIKDSAIRCSVVTGGVLSDHKGLNRRGGGLSAPSLTYKDHADIKLAAQMDVDYLALSFTRNAEDVVRARELFKAAGGQGGLVSKIERAEAVADHENLDQIILASDGVMVARGDLAVEIGDAELLGVQKHIIQRARQLNRFVITATQMMESMIHSPQPTRAEVSDVANAVLDGTDAVMLSAETAVGDHPATTVRAMDRIVLGAERAWQTRQSGHRLHEIFHHVDESIAMAAMYVANHLDGVRAIIALTETGRTPRQMSRIRTGLPICALTPHARTQRRMAVYRGVLTMHFESGSLPADQVNTAAVQTLERMGLVRRGDRVIITKGDYNSAQGGTNALKIVEVGAVIR